MGFSRLTGICLIITVVVGILIEFIFNKPLLTIIVSVILLLVSAYTTKFGIRKTND